MSDKLQELIEAVHRLQNVIRSIGPEIHLTGIEIGGGRFAGYSLDRAIQASPSFLQSELYPDARKSPQVRELMGVRIDVSEKNT